MRQISHEQKRAILIRLIFGNLQTRNVSDRFVTLPKICYRRETH